MLFEDVNRREGLALSATLVECRSCCMRYLNPAPDMEWMTELYRTGQIDPVETNVNTVSRCQDEGSQHFPVLRRLNRLLRGRPHSWPEVDGHGRSILDFGCHDGSKLERWHRRGWKVAGVDLNESAIEVARRRNPDGRFWSGDLLMMKIQDRFDVIRADNVVEHLYNPVMYLKALSGLLKPGGFLRVFVPNGAALSVLLFGRYSYVHWFPFHLNFFTPATLRIAMEQAGLGDLKCTVFNPVGSWMHSQRQLLLSPGFDLRPVSLLDRAIRKSWLLNYPGETVAQWMGLGEEVIGTGRVVS